MLRPTSCSFWWGRQIIGRWTSELTGEASGTDQTVESGHDYVGSLGLAIFVYSAFALMFIRLYLDRIVLLLKRERVETC